MKLSLWLLFLVIFVCQAEGQNYKSITFNGSIDQGYYLAVEPRASEYKGVLVLLPGFGQTAESIFPETKIHNVAYVHGILTIAIAGGQKLYADASVRSKLDEALAHLMERYGLEKDQFIIGGFSAGGTIALRYAEYCYEHPSEAIIEPQGVFSVDAPVDLFAIWDYFQREMRKGYSEAGVGEATYVSNLMLREIGDPKQERAEYVQLTPFQADLDQPGNEQYIKDIGVRVYHDVDIVWQLENRRRSLYDSNALPASEMINRLLLLGNDKAEFMEAQQPGYRSSGTRHPHSWSIVDEVELIQWVKECLQEEQ